MNEGNQTQTETTVKAYVRHKKVKEAPRQDHKYIAIIVLVYFIALMAKYQPVLFSTLLIAVASGFAYKYWNDHRVIVVDDLAGEPMPAPKAKRHYRKKSDYMEIYRDGKIEQLIYRGNV